MARFRSNAGLGHWNTVKHLLHYLQGTTTMHSPIAQTIHLVKSSQLSPLLIIVGAKTVGDLLAGTS